jgi:hypothetical protein
MSNGAVLQIIGRLRRHRREARIGTVVAAGDYSKSPSSYSNGKAIGLVCALRYLVKALASRLGRCAM